MIFPWILLLTAILLWSQKSAFVEITANWLSILVTEVKFPWKLVLTDVLLGHWRDLSLEISANDDKVLWHYMVSLGHYEFNVVLILKVYVKSVKLKHHCDISYLGINIWKYKKEKEEICMYPLPKFYKCIWVMCPSLSHQYIYPQKNKTKTIMVRCIWWTVDRQYVEYWYIF